MMRTKPAPVVAPRHCATTYAPALTHDIFFVSAHASETAGLMFAPEMPAKMKTRIVIALPKMSATSI